ncbi:MAG: adenine-specific methyltransferase EcoRI family protein [bacterium]|nr:adenine-specific methyltransferase EcoRI family protein [bacterium]
MASNSDLTTAKRRKKDEFYTQLSDIEKEMRHYKQHFEGKVVLCNCDDPRSSNFFRYFAEKFESLKLKKLIATCYKSQDVDLFSQGTSEWAICQIYEGDRNGNCVVDSDEVGVVQLKGDGDFRSEECIEILKSADIVVTNPPFSLFKEFIGMLVKYDKKFLIIGNMNALKYKECFSLIMANRLWFGASIHSGDREFGVPDDYPLEASGSRVDADGRKYIRVKGVRWYTNLEYRERYEDLPLYRTYSREEFPRLDNYDAINVNKTCDIPMDYEGVMAVPITFMDKYNPKQFEILGCSDNGAVPDCYKLPHFKKHNEPYLEGKKLYTRIFIRHRK